VLGLVSFLLAVQSAAAATSANADMALLALYDAACVRKETPGAGFRQVPPDEMPRDISNQYIGPQTGGYWRRDGAMPAFIAWTRGPGHWGGSEALCTVAIQGARFQSIVAAFSARTGDRNVYGPAGDLRAWERGIVTNAALIDRRDRSIVGVAQHPDNWVAVGTGGMIAETADR
jgi:hypothetical protein